MSKRWVYLGLCQHQQQLKTYISKLLVASAMLAPPKAQNEHLKAFGLFRAMLATPIAQNVHVRTVGLCRAMLAPPKAQNVHLNNFALFRAMLAPPTAQNVRLKVFGLWRVMGAQPQAQNVHLKAVALFRATLAPRSQSFRFVSGYASTITSSASAIKNSKRRPQSCCFVSGYAGTTTKLKKYVSKLLVPSPKLELQILFKRRLAPTGHLPPKLDSMVWSSRGYGVGLWRERNKRGMERKRG